MKKKAEITSVLNHFYQHPVAKVSLELFLTISLVVFLAIFTIKPTIATMSDLIKEIENKKKLEDQLIKKIASLQTAQTEYLLAEPLLSNLDEAIPSTPEVIKSAKIIEKIASENKVIINSLSLATIPLNIDPTIPFSQRSKQELSFSVNITGDYISIRSFVETLNHSKKSFVVSSITFALEEKRGDKKLIANITINVPYFGVTK